MTTTTSVTWSSLVSKEPGLTALLALAKQIRPLGKHFCANAYWFGYDGVSDGLKARLCRLVGWDRPNADDFLGSTESYDVAYQKIYGALPNCRDCTCA